MSDDPRLARLFTYTVFHLGMYIPLGAVLITIFGSDDLSERLGVMPGDPLVWFIFITLLLAGVAGAMVATACITAEKFEQVWTERIGAYGIAPLSGRWWAKLEHAAFWSATIAFGLLMLG